MKLGARSRQVAALVAAVTLAGPAAAQDFAPRTEYRYVGDATLTVNFLDELGNYLDTRTYPYEVLILAGPPRRLGREVEDNPVHLEIRARSVEAQTVEGQLGLSSASAGTMTGMVRHWTLQIDGGRIDGQLTGAEEGKIGLVLDEVNYVNSRRDRGVLGIGVSYDTIAGGSILQGTLDETRAQLHIEGDVTLADRPFSFDVAAVRVDVTGRPMPIPGAAADPKVPQEDGAKDGGTEGDAGTRGTTPATAPAPATPSGTNPLATPAVNPLAPPTANPLADPFVGRFSGEGVAVALEPAQEGYAGMLEYRGQQYPLRATAQATLMRGTFDSGGNAFPFDATLDGDALTLNTGGASYALQREPAPANPLGQ